MKNYSDDIEIRTCELPACSAVQQPTAPLRAHVIKKKKREKLIFSLLLTPVIDIQLFFIHKRLIDGTGSNPCEDEIFR